VRNYPHIISKVYNEPWLIKREGHAAIVRLLETRLQDADEITVAVEPDDEPRIAMDGSTAIIPVHGIIGKHLSRLETMCGGCDLDRVAAMAQDAESNPDVKEMLFDFRSPGGTVTGTPELARRIARMSKRTVAFTDSQCCSGALYLASQCREFYATESSEVGSVGVWSAYFDYSRALAMDGVNVQEISAGKYKTAGAYWKPLTPEERQMLQAQVDKIYREFKDAVTSRRQIDDQYLQGQVFSGQEAVEIGMVDGLVEDISELLPPD